MLTLKSHFYETAVSLGMDGPAAHACVGAYIEKLAGGHAPGVLAELETESGELDEESPEYERLQWLIKHLTRFVYCVGYHTYRDRGWPIGSGEAEAAHRFIPQERLKIVGACWREETLNPMLALRVLRANGWWDEFWEAERERRAA